MKQKRPIGWRWLILATATLSVSAAPGCKAVLQKKLENGRAVSETVQKAFLAAKVNVLQVEAGAGDISVEAADGDEIRIQATKTIHGGRSERRLKPYLEQIKPTAALEGDVLVVRAEMPGALPKDIRASVRYVITAPKRLKLKMETASGNIEVAGMRAGAEAKTASGDISLKAVQGDIAAESASGAIEMEQPEGKSRLTARTQSGNIAIRDCRAEGADFAVELEAASGNIHFSGAAAALTARAASGNIEAEITDGLKLTGVEMSAASGNLHLSLPATADAGIHARTSSGEIQFEGRDAPDGDEERQRTLTLGDGKATVRLKTGSGNIELSARESNAS